MITAPNRRVNEKIYITVTCPSCGAKNQIIKGRLCNCEYCGQSDMICVDEYYASWYTVNFIPCQGRDPRYNDSVENRTHVEIYQCQSCKFGTSVVSTEEQISHKHPAMRAYDLPRF